MLGVTALSPIQDLGALDGSVLLFGGPYGNGQATGALVDAAGRLAIPTANRICTGDVVAYCADAQTCVDLVRAEVGTCVMGNCEESVGFEMDDCGCGYEDGTACDLLAKSWYDHAKASVDAEAKAWMRGLPRIVTFTLETLRVAVVHGAASSINRFMFESTPDAVFAAEIGALTNALGAPPDIVVGGHAGLPFEKRIGATRWINAGVIGMPANDGTPRTWFATLTAENGLATLAFHALAYDHAGAAEAVLAAGLPTDYAATLESGLWPSLDVLPAAEIGRTGQVLALENVTFPA